jgi:hypothetical protein
MTGTHAGAREKAPIRIGEMSRCRTRPSRHVFLHLREPLRHAEAVGENHDRSGGQGSGRVCTADSQQISSFCGRDSQLVGKSTCQQRDNKHESLLVERQKNRELRAQLNRLTGEIIDLASENESLRRELAMQQAIAEGEVALIRPRKTP